jgi:hypothetical protein
MHNVARSVVMGAVVALAACGKPREGDQAARPSGSRMLAEEEILASQAGNMYDVIRTRRPDWLRRSGRPTSFTGPAAEVVVYLDGQRFGDVASLVRLSATSVRYAEYLTPSEAQARFGQGNLGGVIHVHTHATPDR